jgi:CarboxypepD_reg-like domain
MKRSMKMAGRCLAGIVLFISMQSSSRAQSILDKNISIQVNHQRLDNVLEILSNQGDFYFSYHSTIIRKDSLVSLSVSNKPLRQVLDMLFNASYEFKESGNYIIIRRRPIQLTLVTNKAVTEDRVYTVTGYVVDDNSGARVEFASIYEKKLLASALTNEQGFFKLKLRSRARTAALTVSKEFYEDTTVVIQPKYNQQVTITIVPIEDEADNVVVKPEDYLVPDTAVDVPPVVPPVQPHTDSIKVERSRLGKLLISSRQKIQSLNLRKFFTERPFQVSVLPGVSTHGRLGAQVINNFSLNIFGGYDGGVNGIEVGGLFNIDKKNVRYVQVGGLANVVGGTVTGAQVAGINNTVLENAQGAQVGGISNFVKGKFLGAQVGGIYNHVAGGMSGAQIGGIGNFVRGKVAGLQLGGIYNHVTDSVKGAQIGGIGNFSRKSVMGVQLAGIANVTAKDMVGVQIGGILNYAKRLKGLQIGLINISDTSEGYSIGLINIILKGYHKLSFSTNEILNVNAAFKTGRKHFYNILQAGMNTGNHTKKAYSFGYGLGGEISLGRTFSLNPELTSQYLYLGSWDYLNLLNKVHLNVNIKLAKFISIFAGPSFAVYYSNQPSAISNYKFELPSAGAHTINFGNKVSGWFGWNAGINFF